MDYITTLKQLNTCLDLMSQVKLTLMNLKASKYLLDHIDLTTDLIYLEEKLIQTRYNVNKEKNEQFTTRTNS